MSAPSSSNSPLLGPVISEVENSVKLTGDVGQLLVGITTMIVLAGHIERTRQICRVAEMVSEENPTEWDNSPFSWRIFKLSKSNRDIFKSIATPKTTWLVGPVDPNNGVSSASLSALSGSLTKMVDGYNKAANSVKVLCGKKTWKTPSVCNLQAAIPNRSFTNAVGPAPINLGTLDALIEFIEDGTYSRKWESKFSTWCICASKLAPLPEETAQARAAVTEVVRQLDDVTLNRCQHSDQSPEKTPHKIAWDANRNAADYIVTRGGCLSPHSPIVP